MTRRPRTTLTEDLIERVIELNREHYPEEVARQCGISAITVCRVLQRAGIAPTRKEYQWRAEPAGRDPWKHKRDAGGKAVHVAKPQRPAEPTLPTCPATPMEAAKECFVTAPLMEGKPPRLVVTRDSMTLDGREIGLYDLMRKTNAMRAAWGLEQIVTNPVWRVTLS